MSFLFPGWYLIEYGVGADAKRVAGFIEGGTDMGGTSFLRVESAETYGKRVRHIQVGLIQSMEEMAAPEKKVEEQPPEEDAKPAERTETNFPPAPTSLPLAVRVDWVCTHCDHSLYDHSSWVGCDGMTYKTLDEPYTYEGRRCDCRLSAEAMRAFFALDAQARLRRTQEQARECVAAEEEQPTTDRRLCRICQHQMNRHTGGAVSMCAAFGCTCPLIKSKAEPAQEEQMAANSRPICQWCHHTQDCHSVDAGGKIICGMCEMVRDVCPAPWGERNVNTEEPQKVESEPLPNIENEEQLARDFRRVCKWCHHSQAWHAVSGGVMTMCGMMGCRCPVLRGDPVFREAEKEGPPYAESGKGAPDATREVGEVSLTHKGEDTEQAASRWDDFDTFLTDTLAAAGIDKPAFVQWWKEKDKAWATAAAKTQQQQGAALADFERALGEARADVLRGCEDPPKGSPWPPFRTCVDCGCPWLWHEAVVGRWCSGLNCECRNTREDAERFREEVDQPKAENARRVERNVL